jgi:hypothetical protein
MVVVFFGVFFVVAFCDHFVCSVAGADAGGCESGGGEVVAGWRLGGHRPARERNRPRNRAAWRDSERARASIHRVVDTQTRRLAHDSQSPCVPSVCMVAHRTRYHTATSFRASDDARCRLNANFSWVWVHDRVSGMLPRPRFRIGLFSFVWFGFILCPGDAGHVVF